MDGRIMSEVDKGQVGGGKKKKKKQKKMGEVGLYSST